MILIYISHFHGTTISAITIHLYTTISLYSTVHNYSAIILSKVRLKVAIIPFPSLYLSWRESIGILGLVWRRPLGVSLSQ